MRPECRGCERDAHLLRLAAHVELPAPDVLARVVLARRGETAPLLDVLVQALEEVGHPADARLEAVVEALRAELREMDAGRAVTQMEARSCPASKVLRSVTGAW